LTSVSGDVLTWGRFDRTPSSEQDHFVNHKRNHEMVDNMK
jgi:hypothetical protein